VSVAGAACMEAWKTPAITTDDQMNIPQEHVNLAELLEFERNYIGAAHAYVNDFFEWLKC
jgi:hypothetical protein